MCIRDRPLGGGGEGGVQAVDDDVAGKGGDPLAAHRIAFVGHGRGTDLVFLKGLFHLLEVLKDVYKRQFSHRPS